MANKPKKPKKPDTPETPDAHQQARSDAPPKRGPDRRKNVVDTRATGLERRRGPGRRRSDFMKQAEEGEMSQEQFLFIKAVDAYKRVNNRPYPSWTEVLEVLRKLGYRKTVETELNLPGVEDWTEPPDAPAFTESECDSDDDIDEAAA